MGIRIGIRMQREKKSQVSVFSMQVHVVSNEGDINVLCSLFNVMYVYDFKLSNRTMHFQMNLQTPDHVGVENIKTSDVEVKPLCEDRLCEEMNTTERQVLNLCKFVL